jgi:glycosyltransferase involved in cell wall biosynthesis
MKILYVAPHLSTGGMPQYLYKQISYFCKEHQIEVVDYTNSGGDAFVVQKNRIKELVPVHNHILMEVYERMAPDVIHFQEIPETFLPSDVLEVLFSIDRKHFNIVTPHSSTVNPDTISYHPDKYVFVCKWSQDRFAHLAVDSDVWTYPTKLHIYDKAKAKAAVGFREGSKHVLHVGLFTPGKDQAELFEIARKVVGLPIQFHFVGNQASNFEHYWGPLMENKPSNCFVWGERDDVDTFYKAADLFYFPSKYELYPLSLLEALSYNLPCMFRKLPSYLDDFDKMENVTYITENVTENKSLLLKTLQL